MKILIAPGMGDIYWVFVKLKTMLEQQGIEKADVYLWEGAHPSRSGRSVDYVKRVPFVEYAGSYDEPPDQAFAECYQGLTTIIADYEQFDFFMCPNGVMRRGHDWLNAFLPEYEAQWQFELTSVEEPDYRSLYGDYIVSHISEESIYRRYWLDILTDETIYTMYRTISHRLGVKVVLTGREWDNGINNRLMFLDAAHSMANESDSIFVDLSGQTSIDQFFALIKQSKGVFGVPSGATIKSVYFKKPTFMVWSKRCFEKSGFYSSLVNPESHKKWYNWGVVEDTPPDQLAQSFCNLVEI